MTNDFFDDLEEDFSDDNLSSEFDDDLFTDDYDELSDNPEDELEPEFLHAQEEHSLNPSNTDQPHIGFGNGKQRSEGNASNEIEAAFPLPADSSDAGGEESKPDDSSTFVSFIRDVFQGKSK